MSIPEETKEPPVTAIIALHGGDGLPGFPLSWGQKDRMTRLFTPLRRRCVWGSIFPGEISIYGGLAPDTPLGGYPVNIQPTLIAAPPGLTRLAVTVGGALEVGAYALGAGESWAAIYQGRQLGKYPSALAAARAAAREAWAFDGPSYRGRE